MATLYKTNGEMKEVKPKKGKWFTFEELKDFIRSEDGQDMVQIVPLNTEGMNMVCNEEGKSEPGTCLSTCPKNVEAEKMWEREYPIAQYPNNNDQCICGNALVVHDSELEQ